jgi:hypothetical protein
LRVNFKVADDRVFRILELAAAAARQSVVKKDEVLEEA